MQIARLFLLLCFTIGTGVLLRDHSGPTGEALLESLGPQPIAYHGKNRLQKARSAYLRAAADQPVWWYEWGREAFLMARALNRPILLDIGADWCHWCHVMDRETYSNPEVAELINAHFIAIKVDRDARPDLDHRYQVAVRALSEKGGWPLTAFLTTNGDVYYGGSTFFASAAGNVPGLLELLPRLAEAYQREGDSIQTAAQFLRQQLRNYLAIDVPAGRLNRDHLDGVVAAAAADFDRDHGGFGAAGPKFPEPEVWRYLQQRLFYAPTASLREMIDVTLHHLARGGVYDQLGGGFHRYAVDREWRTPHFEKLLSGNAALLRLYLEAYTRTTEELYRDVVEQTAAFLVREFRDPATGLFRHALNADDGVAQEGGYYLWTKEELGAVLTPEEQQVAMVAYGVRDVPRDLTDQPRGNVLTLAGTPEELAPRFGWTADRVRAVLATARATLLARRAERPAPSASAAAYVNSNAMTIGALLRVGMVLARDDWQLVALTALERLWSEAWDAERGMARGVARGAWIPDGLLTDQIWMLHALLDAYEATENARYLDRALLLATLIERRFADPGGGGFRDRTAREQGSPLLGLENDVVKNFFDQDEAADNPVLAMAYDRLANLTGDVDWRLTAEGVLLSLAGMHPGGVERSLASYAAAVLYHLEPPAQVTIVGPAADATVRRLLAVARQTPRPGVIVRRVADAGDTKHLLPEVVRGQLQAVESGGKPLAFLCAGTACARPTTDPAELDRLLLTFYASLSPR